MTETARRIEIEEPIAFIDLQAQRRRLGERIDQAMARSPDLITRVMSNKTARSPEPA